MDNWEAVHKQIGSIIQVPQSEQYARVVYEDGLWLFIYSDKEIKTEHKCNGMELVCKYER